MSRPRIRSSRGRAGVLVGLDACELRLCDPCACVRPCVPCVSRPPPGCPRGCLFAVSGANAQNHERATRNSKWWRRPLAPKEAPSRATCRASRSAAATTGQYTCCSIPILAVRLSTNASECNSYNTSNRESRKPNTRNLTRQPTREPRGRVGCSADCTQHRRSTALGDFICLLQSYMRKNSVPCLRNRISRVHSPRFGARDTSRNPIP